MNPATGAGTLLEDTGFASIFGLAYTNGTLYGFTSGAQGISLNTVTGAARKFSMDFADAKPEA